MNDLYPPESLLWSTIQSTARGFFENFGFSEIITPLVEKTELFSRSVGQTTDIIEKQMYTFEDKKGESISLRPEGTASVVRAYLEHQLYHPDPYKKFYYAGPMYRYERMQKGRYRQFYQFGVEIFGSSSPRVDAETIYMLTQFYHEVGVKSFEVEINSLGCPDCRPSYREKLLEYLRPLASRLCEDCQKRLEKNPMRTFDCKEEKCGKIAASAPQLIKYLCKTCESHFEMFKEALHQLNVVNTINPRMVRGLDYYVKTAFEIVSRDLGAQNALGGGGRYDGLVKTLGGPDIPAFGFAGGVERLALVLPPEAKPRVSLDLFVAALGIKAQAFSYALVNKLRLRGVKSEIDYEDRPLKAQMKRADRFNSKYVLIIGDDEMDKGGATLRNMTTTEQKTLPMGTLLDDLPKEIRA